MINLFLHHLNACKVKLRLHLRGTKEKSFEINKADSLDNWIFILLFGTAYRCKKYRICQQNDWKLQYLTTRNRKHRYLSWKRLFYISTSLFSAMRDTFGQVPIYSSSPWSSSSTSSSPSSRFVALFVHSSEQVQASVQGKRLPTHEHRLVWQVPWHPQQTNSIMACGAGARSV